MDTEIDFEGVIWYVLQSGIVISVSLVGLMIISLILDIALVPISLSEDTYWDPLFLVTSGVIWVCLFSLFILILNKMAKEEKEKRKEEGALKIENKE